MTMITILIPEDTPMTDTISAHNHETIDYRLFLGEKDILSISQNPAERKLKINSNR